MKETIDLSKILLQLPRTVIQHYHQMISDNGLLQCNGEKKSKHLSSAD